jgi:TatD DNase family protein
MEKMLIETDSPYLSPDPLRGKSNEPANVKIIAEKVASIKGITLDDVANITTKNFNFFFFNE